MIRRRSAGAPAQPAPTQPGAHLNSGEDTGEGPTKSKEPIVDMPGHEASGPPDKIGDHHGHLLSEEDRAEQLVRLHDIGQGGVRENMPHRLPRPGWRQF